MSKRILQDFLPTSRPEPAPRVSVRRDAQIPSERPYKRAGGSRGGGSRLVITLGILGALSVVLYALTGFVSRATIYVTPRTETVTVDYSLRARKGKIVSDLHFETVTHAVQDSVSVPANGTQHVERKAKGTIIVYNSYSSAPQLLVKNTRFESKTGNIYRIQEDVTIPGSSGGLPGSKEVEVVADEAGASYNTGLGDFTIPGFKGTPRYEKFYGRSKTEISGGFLGDAPNASEEDVAAARRKLEEELVSQVRREALTEIREGYVPYDGATRVVFKEVQATDSTASSSNDFILKGEARLEALIFNQAELTSVLASRALEDYSDQVISVPNIHDLDLVLSDTNLGSFESVDDVIFRLRGPALFVWGYDKEDLTTRLAGQRNSNYRDILKTFPTIVKADAEISPFWAFSFPTDSSRIRVAEQLPGAPLKTATSTQLEPPR